MALDYLGKGLTKTRALSWINSLDRNQPCDETMVAAVAKLNEAGVVFDDAHTAKNANNATWGDMKHPWETFLDQGPDAIFKHDDYDDNAVCASDEKFARRSEIRSVLDSTTGFTTGSSSSSASSNDGRVGVGVDDVVDVAGIRRKLIRIASEAMGNDVKADDCLVDAGMDSLVAIEIQGTVSNAFGVTLTVDIMSASNTTVDSLTDAVIALQRAETTASAAADNNDGRDVSRKAAAAPGLDVAAVTKKLSSAPPAVISRNDSSVNFSTSPAGGRYQPPSVEMKMHGDPPAQQSTIGGEATGAAAPAPGPAGSTLNDSMDLLATQLMDPSTLMNRLEDRRLNNLLQRWQQGGGGAAGASIEGGGSSLAGAGVTSMMMSAALAKHVTPPAPHVAVAAALAAARPLPVPAAPTTATHVPFSLSVHADGRGHVLRIEGDKSPAATKENLARYVRANFDRIETELRTRGGLLFRDCGLDTARDFREVLELFQVQAGWRDYRDGISPRTKVIEGVFTSTVGCGASWNSVDPWRLNKRRRLLSNS